MVITLITWGIMLFLFGIYGIAINYLIKRMGKYNRNSGYDIIWLGIVCITVYAQYFSLFYKVGRVAVYFVVCMALFLVFIIKDEYIAIIKRITEEIGNRKKLYLYLGIFVCVVFAGILFTIRMPQHYDTYLYHAQNIKWIEEYGVVKGLGNFHNRFAYNSSFMCLQALFSFSWCVWQSLHTLNGFLWCFMMLYSLTTLKVYKKRFFFSDMLRILTLFYLCSSQTLQLISSPHTDLMTMLLVVYIITRWVDLLEEDVKYYFPYGILCLLGIFAVSVKLSAVLILVLVLKPAVQLLWEKRWKVILAFVGVGCIIIIPFLVRNVIISGYLVYPYASIDLFNVDWKMPVSQVEFDNHEIIAWGRMLNDVKRYEEPITIWLPVWLEKNSVFNQVCMVLNILLLPASIGIICRNVVKKRFDESLVLASFCILFLGWLLTAPLLRYGTIYMFLQPLFCLNIIGRKLFYLFKEQWKYVVYIIALCICIGMLKISVSNVNMLLNGCSIYPVDYSNSYQVRNVEWNNLEIFIPDRGDQVSYHYFPSTPYLARLELIELRGENIEDGFRIKEEYIGRQINTYGFLGD